ncbi:DNA damage-repair/toleration protein DRT100 [Linum perenne]
MKHLLSLIPLILLPILIVSSHVPLVFGRCREDQQSLLLQLKHDLNFEVSDSQKSVWWNASTDCCEWPGISCDPGGLGRVIGFHLNNEGITRGGGGGLNNSTALFSLRYLEYLDLSHNKFNTTIPAALGNLTNLRYLDLSHADFFGPIPASISQLTSLTKTLRLSFNQLQGPIPRSIFELPSLRVLSLSHNRFRGSVQLSWIQTLQNLTYLNLSYIVDFSNNYFNGTIPSCLLILNLSHNAFSSQIPSGFGNLSNVESLDLSHNKLTGKIPNELAGLTFLSCMDLSDNYLVGRIPTGTQFQSFDNTSFGGNPDLCGQPLSKSCTDPPAPQNIIVNNGKSSVGIDWDILSKVFGFFCGLGLIMLPASLWPSFRIWFWPKIDYVILWMFPKLYTKDWNNRLRARKTRLRNKQRKAIQ